MPNIRAYRPEDRVAIGTVCTRTGNSGDDATGMFCDDELLPMIYAYPYVDFAPEWCWVTELDGEVSGYVLGVPSVPEFAGWWTREWAPRLRRAYPGGEPRDSRSEKLLAHAVAPGFFDSTVRADYPAELHIDLLPAAQGIGVGRRLIATFLDACSSAGVPGIAIGVGARNSNALAFYDHLGFSVAKEHHGETGKAISYTLVISSAENTR